MSAHMHLPGPAGSAAERALAAQTTDTETVVVVLAKFRRICKEFREALLHDAALQECRDRLASEGLQTEIEPQGAKIFVEPEHMLPILEHLREVGVLIQSCRIFLRDLRPWHVIASSTFFPKVKNVANQVKGRQLKVTASTEFAVPFPRPVAVDLTESSGAHAQRDGLMLSVDLEADEGPHESWVPRSRSVSGQESLAGAASGYDPVDVLGLGTGAHFDDLDIEFGFFTIKNHTSVGQLTSSTTQNTFKYGVMKNPRIEPIDRPHKKPRVQSELEGNMACESGDFAETAESTATAPESQSLGGHSTQLDGSQDNSQM